MIKSIVKTNFTSGELAYEMLGRGDLKAYENGALFLRNVFISPTGGIKRRYGLRFIDDVGKRARLISFAFNTEQTYLFVLIDKAIKIYREENLVATLTTPWLENDLQELRWTQSADTILIAHPNYPLKKITRTSHTVWNIEDWTFYSADGYTYQPFFKFAKPDVTLTLSALTGTGITVTSSSNFFSSSYVGKRLRVGIGEIEITGYTNATTVTADVTTASLFAAGEEPADNTTADWKEEAFSSIRGYPVAVTFHQDRLIIGGSRDLPNRLWMSKSADMQNFDLGEGLDDEAIEFGLLSDQVNAIKAVFSGNHLEVFTSGAEWMVTGEPLTPTSIQLKRQTRVGSPSYCYVPPRNVDGATIFCSGAGTSIREFLYSDLEESYQSSDLAMISHHLMNQPIDQDYDDNTRLLFVVMVDGSLCTLTNYRSESVSAWSKHETDGNFISVAVVGSDIYVIVERDENYYLEVFDKNCFTDSTLEGSALTAKSTWSGLDHIEGKEVAIIADDLIVASKEVSEGAVELDVPAKKVSIGLPFTHKVVPLPPACASSNSKAVKAVRLIRGIFRVLDTPAVEIDTGMGLKPALPLSLGGAKNFSSVANKHTKDIILQGIGWSRNILDPLWKIESSAPAAFNLLSVTTEMKESE